MDANITSPEYHFGDQSNITNCDSVYCNIDNISDNNTTNTNNTNNTNNANINTNTNTNNTNTNDTNNTNSNNTNSNPKGNPFWKKKRKSFKLKQKAVKRKYETKEEYMASIHYQSKKQKNEMKKYWKCTDLLSIKFNEPEVVVDLSFGEFMTDKEIRSTVSQLLHLYGALRQSSYPLKVTFTDLKPDGNMRTLLNNVGLESWKVFTSEAHFTNLFPIEKIVYLSPDSPNVLTELQKDKVYVIGGIVDHNRLKGLSYSTAQNRGIYTARLPIVETIGKSIANSLNPNHVFSMLMYQAQHSSWMDTMKMFIPQRYLTDKKGNNNKNDRDSDGESDSDCDKSITLQNDAGNEINEGEEKDDVENKIPAENKERKGN